jgi:cation/acetate symporter
MMAPGSLMADPISAFSLSLGLLFGTAGLPHIMMRFFTVPNAKEARKSVFYATGFIGLFFLVTIILGAALLRSPSSVPTRPSSKVAIVGGKLIGGGNMPVMHLAKAVGGDIFLGFLSAVAFATILAVVSGLALAGASAISHDLYARVIKKGSASSEQEMRVTRFASVGLGHHCHRARHRLQGSERAVPRRARFRRRLVGQLPGPHSVDVLERSDHPWRAVGRHCRSGVVGWSGRSCRRPCGSRFSEIKAAIFPYDHPAIVSMSLAFFVTWLLSVTDKSARANNEKAEAYEEQYIRAQTGLGSSGAHAHLTHSAGEIAGEQRPSSLSSREPAGPFFCPLV